MTERHLSSDEPILARLLASAQFAEPDTLPALVREVAGEGGFANAVIHLVDKEQRLLVPLGGDDTLPIDTTVAGQAYRSRTAIPDESGRVFFPLVDGTDRLGVLAATVARVDDATLKTGVTFTKLVAELIVSKSAYGDGILGVQRLKEMTLAAELRWAMLPPLSFSSPRLAVAGLLEPAYDIAGDCFDYAVNRDTLHLAIFDAMGHGLTASRLVNLAMMSYRHSRRSGLTLEETYRAMDEVVDREFGGDYFVTAQMGTLDLGTGKLSLLNAGHPVPLLLRDRQVAFEMECEPSPPPGVGARNPLVNHHLLRAGDSLLLYSDGVIEAREPGGREFGLPRLREFLPTAMAQSDLAAETVRKLVHALLEYQQGHLEDDATVLLAQWAPAAPPSEPSA